MTQPAQVTKPLPEADDASKPFWDGAMEGRLVILRCADCKAWRMPWRHHCDQCLSDRSTWEQASGRGVVRTFGIMHQKYHPAFEVPYNVTIVELAEGPRITTNLVGVSNADIRVGMPVVVDWERHSDITLPKFRPA
ncbi:MAG: OB-fold domain-containing protein [Chloroflexi bacterium]|nr:OB-fold domain-containing protein [Chloroflexota bacterium]